VQEIEVAVRSAAQHQPAMLDIKHRVPFEEARKTDGESVSHPSKKFKKQLVGGLEPWNFMTFHSVGNFIIPN
jgi:hypothetical protein